MRFASIIWENEPLASRELVRLCDKELDWKKSTTYTIIRKLCEKGILQNVNGIVSSIVSKDEYIATQSEKFVEDTFSGSLPKFLTSFSMRKKLSEEEIEEIQNFIDEHREV